MNNTTALLRRRARTSALATPLLLSASLSACVVSQGTPYPQPADDGDKGDARENQAAWPDEDFRASAPAPGPVRDVSAPTPEVFTTKSGIEVRLVPATLPYVSMTVYFDTGAVSDPKGKTGRASICAELIEQGTKRLDKVAWSQALDDRALSIGVGSGNDSTSINLTGLVDDIEEGAKLLEEMLREPGLRQEDLDRIKVRRKAAIVQSRATPESIGGRLIMGLLYGFDHPYGRIDSEAQVDAITVADCKAFASGLRPGGAKAWVVGRTSKAQIEKIFDETMVTWKGKASRARAVGPGKSSTAGIYVVHVAGAAQSQIFVAHTGPARSAPDFEATLVAAAVYGGGFTSRLNMNLREDKGIAYGARGGFSYSRTDGRFMSSSSVDTPHTDVALREIAKELGLLRSSEPTADEVKREIDGALLSLPAEFATPRSAANSLRSLEYYGLPFDWHAGFQQRLRAVKPSDALKAAQAHIQAEGLTVLVVGDLEVIRPGLEKIVGEGLYGSRVIELDADGAIVKGKNVAALAPKGAAKADPK